MLAGHESSPSILLLKVIDFNQQADRCSICIRQAADVDRAQRDALRIAFNPPIIPHDTVGPPWSIGVSLHGDYEIISRDLLATYAHRLVVKNIDYDSAESCSCAKCGEFLGVIELEAVSKVLSILGAPRRYAPSTSRPLSRRTRRTSVRSTTGSSQK